MPSVKLKPGSPFIILVMFWSHLKCSLFQKKTQNNFTQIEQMSILKIDFKVQGEGEG